MLAVCTLGFSGAKLVTPWLFQLGVVLATLVWRFLKCGTLRLMPVVYWYCKFGCFFSSKDLSLVALRSDIALCFQFRVYSVFSRLVEYLFCCDSILSSRYSICLFCQHNIHLLIYTHISMHTTFAVDFGSYFVYSNNVHFCPSQ